MSRGVFLSLCAFLFPEFFVAKCVQWEKSTSGIVLRNWQGLSYYTVFETPQSLSRWRLHISKLQTHPNLHSPVLPWCEATNLVVLDLSLQPTQTGLCKFGWVWRSLTIKHSHMHACIRLPRKLLMLLLVKHVMHRRDSCAASWPKCFFFFFSKMALQKCNVNFSARILG